MSDYASRSEISPVDRVGPRAPVPVPAVQSATSGSTAGNGRPVAVTRPAAGSTDSSSAGDDIAGAAEYVKVHARIADILADLRSQNLDSSVDGAASAIDAMMPSPMVFVPLPPASKEAVEQAVTLAKKIAQQASYAHAAQAHIKRAMVDQLLSGGA